MQDDIAQQMWDEYVVILLNYCDSESDNDSFDYDISGSDTY